MLLLYLGLVSLTACRKDSTSAKTASDHQQSNSPKRVKAVPVVSVPMERVIKATGSLLPYEQATLSVKVPGRLEALAVDIGDRVVKGQKLAQIEQRDYELRLKQAEAMTAQARTLLGLPPEGADDRVDPEKTSLVKQAYALLQEARKTQERIAKLSTEKISSPSELETAEAGFQVALNRHQDAIEEARNRQALLLQRRAELEIARQQLADTAIVAPFDGAIQSRRANVGEYLVTGAPVLTLVRVDPLRLRLEVPERAALVVRLGQQVRLSLEGDTNIYTGELARLSPSLTEQTRMLVAEADVPNKKSLRPGAFARADIIAPGHDASLVVPTNAVITFAGIEKIFAIADGKAAEKRVTTGRRINGKIEIIGNIRVGELVIVEPGNLQNGQNVLISEPAHAEAR